ncbi:hypothetical protein SNEBB_005341 [Seison nebaliae]|nr:hypothetical protein SNEBB_005341 [Seison nebaliae]
MDSTTITNELKSITQEQINKGEIKELDIKKKLIVLITDRDILLFDQYINLPAVQLLEGQLIFELVELFISGTLEESEKYIEKNEEFLEENKIDISEIKRKMEILTFLSLAENKTEIPFKDIGEALNLEKSSDIELFVVRLLKTGTIRVKINESEDKLIINHVPCRFFAEQHWKELRDQFITWNENLSSLTSFISTINQSESTESTIVKFANELAAMNTK